MSSDAYLDLALAEARRFAARDARFVVRREQRFVQGNNNRVVQGLYADKPAVFKFYGAGAGKHIGAPSMRRGRELAFLQTYASSGVVPEVYAHGGDYIVMEEIAGISLWQAGEAEDHGFLTDTERWDRLSYEVGSAHAKILKIEPTEEAKACFEQRFCDSRTFSDDALELIDRGDHRLRTDPAFSGDDLKSSVDFLRSWFSWGQIEGPWALLKQDWNPTNTILEGGRFRGFVDFEQCFVGPTVAYLGAVADCTNSSMQRGLLSWPLLKAGYQDAVGRPLDKDDLEAILAMANLNAWRVMVGCDVKWLTKARKRLLPKDHVL